MTIIKNALGSILVTCALFSAAYGAENSFGPFEIISGGWGSADDQFGFLDRYNKQTFPSNIAVDEEGYIAVSDPVNTRIKIYSKNGKLHGIVKVSGDSAELDDKPPRNIAVTAGRLIVNGGVRYQVFDYRGKLKSEFTVPDSRFEGFVRGGCAILQQMEKNRYGSYEDKGYRKYSPEGAVVKSYNDRPPELGSIKEETEDKSNVNEAWWTIAYDDKIFTIVEGGQHLYARDQKGYLYGIGSTPFERYDECGVHVGSLDWPQSKYEVIRPGTAASPELREAVVEYGTPVIAPNGDLFAWKRTPAGYGVLKWTWEDKKNVNVAWQNQPRNVTAIAASDGILVSWDISLQDPACITGYELRRSTTSGGPYEKIGTVDKGLLRYLDTSARKDVVYFYTVRSMIKKEFSGFANEAEVRR